MSAGPGAAPRRLLLTGGGTAGHVNPALAIGSALKGDTTRVLYVGVRGRAEERVVPREGIPLRFVRASGYPGLTPSPALARFAVDLAIGTLQALGIVLGFRPDIVVGTGGYASAPVIFAVSLLRRLGLLRARVFIHEQNSVPGKLNQFVGRFADRVFVTFPETLAHFPRNGVVTGYPLRRRIGSVSREEARRRLDFTVPEGRRVVFVFGGSLGARTLNRALVDALGTLLPHRDRLFVVHGTGLFKGGDGGYDAERDTRERLAERYGEEERRAIEEFYVARPFFHDIECLYALADLAVVRGGAGTLNEISAVGLPAIVIPKANLPGDHQVMNARAMERALGAEVVYEETVLEDGRLVEQVDGAVLAGRILALLGDEGRLAEMARRSRGFLRHDALDEIERRIRGGAAETAPGTAAEAPLDRSPLRSRTLLALLERTLALRGPSGYAPEMVVSDPGDMAYYTSRAASLLVSPSWEERNVGVKLIGLLSATDKVPLLVALLEDRRPASLLKRMFGGDFEQVGFIRRNVLSAFARLGVVTPEVEAVLLRSFEDPYYEVRAEAARTAAAFGDRLTRRAEIVAALSARLHDRSMEVAVASAEALGRLGGEADALPCLLALADFRFWRLRSAALRGILSLVERGQVSDLQALSRRMPEFILTSTDFTPQFEIKASYRRAMEAVAKRAGSRVEAR